MRDFGRLLILAALLLARSYSYALDRSQWKWTRSLPSEITDSGAPRNRTPAAVDAFFNHGVPRRSVAEILTALGRPDAFSPLIPPKGGVLRFTLQDGGAVEVHTPDFHIVFEAFRFDKSGRGTLLEK